MIFSVHISTITPFLKLRVMEPLSHRHTFYDGESDYLGQIYEQTGTNRNSKPFLICNSQFYFKMKLPFLDFFKSLFLSGTEKIHRSNLSKPKPQKVSFAITCTFFVQACMRINLQWWINCWIKILNCTVLGWHTQHKAKEIQ